MKDFSNINAGSIAEYVRELEFENEKLKEELSETKEGTIRADKFYGTAITVDACAAMHGVCRTTVFNYIAKGFIPRHPNSTDHKILIRTSDALLFDFKQARKHNIKF